MNPSAQLLRALGCLLLAAALASPSKAAAPYPSPIGPGDVIFSEFYDGWHKLDPATGEVTELPWPENAFVETVRFDVDGSILYLDSFDGLYRLNPRTGAVTEIEIEELLFVDGFVVEPNGDLLIANSGEVLRYSRSTGAVSTLAEGTFFSPGGIARTDDGRLFITEFFEDLYEIDPSTGATTVIPGTGLSIPSTVVARSDGDLLIDNFSPDELKLVDPDTGAVTLFTDDLPGVNDFALDESDNLWLTSGDGVFYYDSTGGPGTLIAEFDFFSPNGIAVVPSDYTAPAVPEPGAIGLLAMAATFATTRRRRLSAAR